MNDLELQWITPFWPTEKTTSYGSFVYDLWKEIQLLSPSAIPVHLSAPFTQPSRPGSRRLVTPVFGGEPGSKAARIAGRVANPIVRRRVSSLGGSALHLHGGLGLRQALSISSEAPVFLHVHGRLSEATLRNISQSAKSPRRQLVLLPVSEHICEQLRLRDRAETVQVLRNGFNSRVFHPPSSPSARDVISILSVGNLEEHKNIESVVKAVCLLRQKEMPAVLTVVGSGSQRKRLERLAMTLGIARAVHFVGRQPQEAVARLMRSADVFALPSRQEAFGVVFSEAIASGLPVIGGAGTGAAEAIGENGVLVEPDDVVQLAVEIRSAVVATRKRDTSRLRVPRDWRTVAEELLNVYAQFGVEVR